MISMVLFCFLARYARGRNGSSEELLLGTEAWQSCSALLPFAWNVNKPARETKTQLGLHEAQARRPAAARLTVHVHHPW